MLELNRDEEIVSLVQANPTVVIDFWAPWCAPCRMLTPILEKLQDECPDTVFAKVNVEESMEAAKSAGVQVLPTVVVFRDGHETDRITGLKPVDELKEIIGCGE
jgi:thioredoxin